MKRIIFLVAFCIAITSQIHANELTVGISNFTSDLYQRSSEITDGNIIISPFSIINALGLLSLGTNGKSFDEIQTVLQFNVNRTVAANQFFEYEKLVETGAGASPFSIANKIYVQEGYSIRKQFRTVAKNQFSSDAETINFAQNIDAANKINSFVENATNNKIHDLIKPDMISSDSRVILVNAIHFKGTWQELFDKNRTTEENFYISETEKVPVDFMRIEREFNYNVYGDIDASVLEMKYLNSNFSMLIFLPHSRTGLPKLEKKIQRKNLATYVDRLVLEEIDVEIPKFTVEFEINLNDILKKLGIRDIFTQNADLSQLLDASDPLMVSDVVHKAFIEVTETGTEAAAATGVGVVNYSLPPRFRADHPFLYFIWDRNSQTPIFSGRIVTFN